MKDKKIKIILQFRIALTRIYVFKPKIVKYLQYQHDLVNLMPALLKSYNQHDFLPELETEKIMKIIMCDN